MTNNNFAAICMLIVGLLTLASWWLRQDALPAAGGTFTPRDELIHLNDN
jgi:hypothetical protein